MVPVGRKTGPDQQFARQRVGLHAEKPLDEGARRYAAAVGEIALRLAR